jgi:hypothetical protein
MCTFFWIRIGQNNINNFGSKTANIVSAKYYGKRVDAS